MSRILSLPKRMAVTIPVVAGTLLSLTLSAFAQAPRVLGPVNPAATTTLKGNTLAVANSRNDRGRVPDATPTGRLMLVLKQSDAQHASLTKLIESQQDPSSPNFHKWLTTAQFAQQFGVADADIQNVTGFLSSQGFSVAQVLPNKRAVEFSGTTGQLRATFGTEIHTFSTEDQTFFANDRDPKIPSALAPVVAGFASLSNYQPARKLATSTLGQQSILKKGGKLQPLYTDTTAVAENVSPGDIAKLYDIPASATGAGVTIGVLGSSNINLTYLQNYRTTFGLGASTPAVVVDGGDPGFVSNSTVDSNVIDLLEMELISAVAPAASLNYYTSSTTDLSTGVNFGFIRAVDDNAVQVLVLSQQNCEANLGATSNAFLDGTSEQAAALGISVIAPTGDGGSAACDSALAYGNSYSPSASKGLAVNGYSSSPFVTAVGATDTYYPNGTATPVTCCWNVANGGPDTYTSAKGYITEQPWNDTNTSTNYIPGSVTIATGGGVSTAGTLLADGITPAPYPEPAWQVGIVPPTLSNGARAVPDISIFGGDGQNGSAYMVCLQANECVNGAAGSLVYEIAGGTSASAATFGGVAALLVQAHGAQGNLNPTLYHTYQVKPSAFHDVKVGNNSIPCVTGSPNCGAGGTLVTSSGGVAYPAIGGYDLATGLGSPDVAALISAWTPPNTTATATNFTLTVPGSTTTPLTSFVHGSSVQANIAVTSSGATPTGDVGVIAGTAAPSSAGVNYFTLSNGTATDPLALSGLAGGTYPVRARYAGDETHAASLSAPITVTITPESSRIVQPVLSFTPGSAVAYGAAVSAQVYVVSGTNPNGIGTPTGSVTVTDNGAALAFAPLDAQGYATYAGTLPAGAHALGFTYGGDPSYQASSYGSTFSLSVNKQNTSTTLTSSSPTDPRKGTIQLVAVVSTSAASGPSVNWPTGNIVFRTVGSGAKTLGTVAVAPSISAVGTVASIANLSVPGNSLPIATTSVVATYVPPASGNYQGSISGAVSIKTTGAGKALASTTALTTSDGSASYFDYAGSITLNVAVTGTGATPAGTVTLFDNGTALGTVTLSGGKASLPIAQNANTGLLPFTIGQHLLTAQYNGSTGVYEPSAKEATITILDEGLLPDFSLASNTVAGIITPSSASTVYTLQLTSINNFAALGQAVTLTAAAPAGLTCTIGTKTVTFAGATYAKDAVTCGLANGYTIASANPSQRPLERFWFASGSAALACVFLLGMPARRKQWKGMLGAMLALVFTLGIAGGLSGCGGRAALAGTSPSSLSSESQAAVATPAAGRTLAKGNYQVLVTATAPFGTNLQANTATLQTHTVALQVSVQ